MPLLVTITGPIAGGKNTVASAVADLLDHQGRTAVIVDVDDVAAMVQGKGAGALGFWFDAHVAHGALVAQWMRSAVDVVIAVGPVYTTAEQAVLFDPLPVGARVIRVIIDADLDVTWPRAVADANRGRSRDEDFHRSAHARFRALLPAIPSDLRLDSGRLSVADMATAILGSFQPAG